MTWTCEQCGESFRARGTKPRRFCARACVDAWTRREKPSDEWLRQKYVAEGLACPAIAGIVGRDPKRVWEWLQQAGIPTRPRGSDPASHFPKGIPNAFAGKSHSAESRQNMAAARRRVPREAYRNNGHYLKERAGPAHPNWRGGVTPDRQAFYAGAEWKAIAPAVWVRDAFTCQRCGAKPPSGGPKHNRGHIHHIVGFRAVELRAVLTNLVLLCAPCHRWVHSNANSKGELLG